MSSLDKKQTEITMRARRLSVTDSEGQTPGASGVPETTTPGKGFRRRRLSMSPEMGADAKPAELPFPTNTVGTYSCHGIEPGRFEGEQKAKINQDRGGVKYPFGECEGYERALFMVFDGHGAVGDKVSEYVVNTVDSELEALDRTKGPLLDDENMIIQAMKDAFVSTDNALKKNAQIDAELSGTTAVAVFAVHKKGSSTIKLYTANAGDSRAVLHNTKTGKTTDLSEDQKPDTPAEQRRIEKAGGFVSPAEDWGGPARVWLDASMTLPGLAMGRSIGDHLVSAVGVTAGPEVLVQEVKLCDCDDSFLVMASDGVWEFIESKPAAKLVADAIKDCAQPDRVATESCRKLIEASAIRWQEEEGDYRDDITAIVVRFKGIKEKWCRA